MNNANRGKSEILLESGTNEIEIMEFTIYDELYGINVAKVKEIMMASKVKPVVPEYMRCGSMARKLT